MNGHKAGQVYNTGGTVDREQQAKARSIACKNSSGGCACIAAKGTALHKDLLQRMHIIARMYQVQHNQYGRLVHPHTHNKLRE